MTRIKMQYRSGLEEKVTGIKGWSDPEKYYWKNLGKKEGIAL